VCLGVCLPSGIAPGLTSDKEKETDYRGRTAHCRRGLASDGVRYVGAQSTEQRRRVGRRFRSVTKLRLEWYGGGVFLLLLMQQRSKHPQ